MSVRVLKLGGSLFDLPQLAERLGMWRARQEPRADVMVVGGGALADAIRAADWTHALGEAASHALCLEAMGVTAALAREIFRGSQLRSDLGQIERHPATPLQILDVRGLLDGPPPPGGTRLPHSWRVTSDSIAAHIARLIDGEELVLLKSALPTSGLTLQQAADLDLVDAHFPIAIGNRAVRIVNLRDPEFRECRLAGADLPVCAGP